MSANGAHCDRSTNPPLVPFKLPFRNIVDSANYFLPFLLTGKSGFTSLDRCAVFSAQFRLLICGSKCGVATGGCHSSCDTSPYWLVSESSLVIDSICQPPRSLQA